MENESEQNDLTEWARRKRDEFIEHEEEHIERHRQLVIEAIGNRRRAWSEEGIPGGKEVVHLADELLRRLKEGNCGTVDVCCARSVSALQFLSFANEKLLAFEQRSTQMKATIRKLLEIGNG
jgi:hypothetical protein